MNPASPISDLLCARTTSPFLPSISFRYGIFYFQLMQSFLLLSNASFLEHNKTESFPLLGEKQRRRRFASMELRCALSVLFLLIFPLLTLADLQPSCAVSYISSCLSTAIVSACGDLYETQCICATSGQASIASLAGPCLISSCPYTELLAIGTYATDACDQWLRTHLSGATTTASFTNSTRPATTLASTTSSWVTYTNTPTTITYSPTTPTAVLSSSMSTAISTGTASQGLPIGADVGIGVGALALISIFLVFLFLFFRRRRARKPPSPSSHELDTGISLQELPDKPDGLQPVDLVEIPRQELDGFEFPFSQKRDIAPVEADSQSVRAQSRGRMVGTETTAFDFESQKVLITPGLRGTSRASSTAPASASTAGSVRRFNSETEQYHTP